MTRHVPPRDARWTDLPSNQLVIGGPPDLAAGRRTLLAPRVEVGAPQLRFLDRDVPPGAHSPEHRPYAMVPEESPDSTHGRYHALVRRLVSVERALACGC